MRDKEKQKAYLKEWRERNKEKIKEYMKAYGPKYFQDNKERLNPIRQAWRDNNIEKSRSYTRKWYQENKDKLAPIDKVKASVRRKIRTNIDNGNIEKKSHCEKCNHDGSIFRIEKHHEDYSKPLEVIFLCAKCHKIRHIELKKI